MKLEELTIKYLENSNDSLFVNLVRENISFYKRPGFNPLYMGYYNIMEAFDNNLLIGGVSYTIKEETAFVNDIVVREEYRRKSIGTYLINNLFKKFREEGVKVVKSSNATKLGALFAESVNKIQKSNNYFSKILD